MTAKEMISYLIEEAGLDAATAKALVDNEKVAARAATFKQASEYEAVERKAAELEASLNGANGKPGSKAYEKWYQDNFEKIQTVLSERKIYEERYGPLDATARPTAPTTPAFDETAVQKMVDARIQSQYGPSVVLAAERFRQDH